MNEKCKVLSNWGTIGTKKRKEGTTELQLRKVSWFGSAPMWDLREWDAEDKAGKGITMTDDMLRKLKEILEGMEL